MKNNLIGYITIGAFIVIGSLIISKSVANLSQTISNSQKLNSKTHISKTQNFKTPPSNKKTTKNEIDNSKIVTTKEGNQILTVWADGEKTKYEGFDFLVTFEKPYHLLIVDYYQHNSEKHEVIYLYNPQKWEFEK